MRTIKIGTRASRLAMIQAEMVAEAIRAYDPTLKVTLVPMKTTGDMILDRTLDKIGGKGLFVKELDRALLEGEVDITVHSGKDLPVDLNPSLPVVAVSKREDPRDVLVLPQGVTEMDTSLPIGCSSARRRVQLAYTFPGVRVESVRGNVITRLEKLDGGEYGALTLAAAGLRRLDLAERISRVFTIDEMVPAACQGIIAVQAREGEDSACLSGFHDEEAWYALCAERAFIRALEGGCSSPCAAHVSLITQESNRVTQGNHPPFAPESFELRGMYVNEDESVVKREKIILDAEDAETQAREMAERMKAYA